MVKRDPAARAVVGRAMFLSAVVLVVLAALFGTGTLPVEPGARGLVTGALAAVAAIDVLVGLWFIRGGRPS